jgi:hypothetical protein
VGHYRHLDKINILFMSNLARDNSFLLYLERIGKLKNFLLLKEIYNGIKLIATINYGKLYVTKPDLGSYIGGLGGIILSLILLNVNHFFCHRFL